MPVRSLLVVVAAAAGDAAVAVAARILPSPTPLLAPCLSRSRSLNSDALLADSWAALSATVLPNAVAAHHPRSGRGVLD